MRFIRKLFIVSALLVIVAFQVLPSAEVFLFRLKTAYEYNASHFVGILQQCFSNDEKVLRSKHGGKFDLLYYVQNHLEKDSLTLVFRQNDFATFADRKFISMSDPRLVKLYSAHTVDECYKELRRLGIDYVFCPPYDLPLISKTKLAQTIADINLTQLEYSGKGYRLYKVLESPKSAQVKTVFAYGANKGEETSKWSVWNKGLANSRPNSISDPKNTPGIYINNNRTFSAIYTGIGHIALAPSRIFFDSAVNSRATYVLKSNVAGYGILKAFAVFYNRLGEYSGSIQLMNLVLDSDAANGHDIFAQFKFPPDATEFRILYAVDKGGWLAVRSLKIDMALQVSPNALWGVSNHNYHDETLTNVFDHDYLKLISSDSTSKTIGRLIDDYSDSQLMSMPETRGKILYTGRGNIDNAPSSAMRYKLVAQLSGSGLFELLTIHYPHASNAESSSTIVKSHGHYMFPGSKPVTMETLIDAPTGLADFRVAFKAVDASRLGRFVGDIPNECQAVVHSMSVFKNTNSMKEFTGEGTPVWEQVFPVAAQ